MVNGPAHWQSAPPLPYPLMLLHPPLSHCPCACTRDGSSAYLPDGQSTQALSSTQAPKHPHQVPETTAMLTNLMISQIHSSIRCHRWNSFVSISNIVDDSANNFFIYTSHPSH